MELNKIEKQIREKLNSREIQPSSQAWDRLDAMLSVQEETPKKRIFPWFKIAAGFVLFMTVGFFFLTQRDDENLIKGNETTVVESVIDTTKTMQNNTAVVQNGAESRAVKNIDEEVVLKEKLMKDVSNVKQDVSHSEKSKEEQSNIILTEVKKEKVEEKPIMVIKSNDPIIQESKEAIAENKVISKPKLKVDPNALLNQVEGEVTLTFRQKVMKSIVRNYKEAKESFASRNEESSSNQ